MCLFLEILWVKKCSNLCGEKYSPITVNNYFPHAEKPGPTFLRSVV